MLPFLEKHIKGEEFIRTFSQDSDSEDMVWHRDLEDRVIEPIGLTNWMIQIENRIPEALLNSIEIKSGVWHRLIKGSGELTLKIIKRNG